MVNSSWKESFSSKSGGWMVIKLSLPIHANTSMNKLINGRGTEAIKVTFFLTDTNKLNRNSPDNEIVKKDINFDTNNSTTHLSFARTH